MTTKQLDRLYAEALDRWDFAGRSPHEILIAAEQYRAQRRRRSRRHSLSDGVASCLAVVSATELRTEPQMPGSWAIR